MGPGNMGAPAGGLVLLFLAKGCLAQFVLFVAVLVTLIFLRRHTTAQKLLPVASVGILLSIPSSIVSLIMLQFVVGRHKTIDYLHVTVWMVCSSAICWSISFLICKFFGAAKSYVTKKNDEQTANAKNNYVD